MDLSNVKVIKPIGSPDITVPPTMTAEQVLVAMNYDMSQYDMSVAGDVLTLSATAGSKGLLDTRVVNGKVLPLGNTCVFPTNRDIERIAELFPEDNLFETLNDGAKLQVYFDRLAETSEAYVLQAFEAQNAEAAAQLAENVETLKQLLDRALIYGVKTDNPVSERIVGTIADTATLLGHQITLAESIEVDARQRQAQEAERQRILEEIRQEG